MNYQRNVDNTKVVWDETCLIEVTINPRFTYDDVKETLTRMGVANDMNKLTQTCHILYMDKKFFIVHFKELFGLDNREITFTQYDSNRRTTIAKMLERWNMISIVNPDKLDAKYQRVDIDVISKENKFDWILQDKYTLNQTIPVVVQPERRLIVV